MTEMLGYAGTAEIPCVDHRRPARRPLHRPADQDRAVRPAARPLRRPRRGAAGRHRADHGGGLLLVDDRRLQLLGALPGPGHPPDRPGPRDPDGGHPQARHATRSSCGSARPPRASTATTSATRSPRTRSRRWASPARRAASTSPPASSTTSSATRPTRPRTTWRCRPSAGPSSRRSRTASSATRPYGDEHARDRAHRLRLHLRPGPRGGRPRRASEGLSVGAFYPRVLGPFPAEQVKAFTANATRVHRARRSTSPASSRASCAASAASRSRATPSATACPSRPRTSWTSSWKGSRVEHRLPPSASPPTTSRT